MTRINEDKLQRPGERQPATYAPVYVPGWQMDASLSTALYTPTHKKDEVRTRRSDKKKLYRTVSPLSK